LLLEDLRDVPLEFRRHPHDFRFVIEVVDHIVILLDLFVDLLEELPLSMVELAGESLIIGGIA